MNWDEKSLEAGEGRFIKGNEHIITADDQVREEIHVHAFSSGAKWQRDQLRTAEAVARLANFLHDDERQETLEEHEAWCKAPECEARQSYNKHARAAIDALIGEG